MTYREEFGDPVVIPGPNLRSRFTDTETVDEDRDAAASASSTCPRCGRLLAPSTLVCPDDGAALVELPAR